MRYLWPYRVRLSVAVACVMLIAVLWGGGLAVILPGTKVLISEEGLHGWAYNSITQDRLGAQIVRIAPPAARVDGQVLPQVVEVVRLTPDGPAEAAGIDPDTYIIGLYDGDPGHTVMTAGELTRQLAQAEPSQTVRLRLLKPGQTRTETLTVKLANAKFPSRMLGKLAGLFAEPADYAGRFTILLWLLGFAVVITVLRDMLRFVQEYLVASAVWRGVVDLRCDNYNVVLRLPTTFFSEKGVTDSMSRFIADTSELARGQVTLFGKTLVEPGKALAALAIALTISWRLTLLTMVAGPPAFLIIRKFGKNMRQASRRALESWSKMLAVLEETLTGIRVVKTYTMEAAERRRFLQVNRRLLKQQRRMARIDAATAPAVEALGVTAAMGAIAIAGYWVLNRQHNMDSHAFITMMGCLAAMFDPVRKLAKVATRFQRAEAAAERIFELQDEPQEKRVPKAPTLPRHERSIEFRNVHFRYPSASEDALKGINLSIPAGQTIAIVGPNGCGKTTLVSLLPRLFDPTYGEVLIDGRDVSQYSLRSLRRQIGLVTQETVLFHATIGENVSYGLRRPAAEAVLEAGRKAFVDEFVDQLPDGYETMVGEHGATLSGGQRQRIAIARAILRDPAILIFDEAMSQIDTHSERRIHQAMREFIKGRTTVMIAHRFIMVLEADIIVVMDDGRILDIGKHDELLDRCELYRHLCNTQFGGTLDQ